ncbi:hypothetical protein SPURM210S_08281 [Streptomyces purpurascens]
MARRHTPRRPSGCGRPLGVEIRQGRRTRHQPDGGPMKVGPRSGPRGDPRPALREPAPRRERRVAADTRNRATAFVLQRAGVALRLQRPQRRRLRTTPGGPHPRHHRCLHHRAPRCSRAVGWVSTQDIRPRFFARSPQARGCSPPTRPPTSSRPPTRQGLKPPQVAPGQQVDTGGAMTRTRRAIRHGWSMVGVGATATPLRPESSTAAAQAPQQARTAAARAAEDVPCCPGTGGRFFARAR